MSIDRRDTAQRLAEAHFQLEPGLRLVVWFTSGPPDEVRLIEVHEDAIETPYLTPFRFAGSREIPIDCTIAEVSPREWEELRTGARSLPPGWEIDRTETFVRPALSPAA